jgi:alkylation response protein AidB-like acyl-CoA dehydrogenase
MDSHLHATTQSIWQLLADFQHNRFKLAEMKPEVQIGRVFLDRCIELHLKGKLDVEAAAMRKYWLSELECRVVDQCVQMHGDTAICSSIRLLERTPTLGFAEFMAAQMTIRELIARAM